ncbi:hypothetical protein RB213_004580, partial [Colletotrichum asianum]
ELAPKTEGQYRVPRFLYLRVPSLPYLRTGIPGRNIRTLRESKPKAEHDQPVAPDQMQPHPSGGPRPQPESSPRLDSTLTGACALPVSEALALPLVPFLAASTLVVLSISPKIPL